MILFEQITSLPEEYIKRSVDLFLLEDRVANDVTTIFSISEDSYCKANIEVESKCIFVGGPIIKYILADCDYEIFYKDGDYVPQNGIIANISGKSSTILTRERVLLNIIQRLSGIASTTKKYVEIAKPFGVQILDTRKTTPGLRLFEKYAVVMGGGTNHRLDLSAAFLIKDNHLKAGGGITNVIKKINENNKFGLNVELEVDTIEQLKEGLNLCVKCFLLDNMPPDMIREAVTIVRKNSEGNDIFLEASGGITLENLKDYVSTGINAISIGALTHRIVSSNIHINFE